MGGRSKRSMADRQGTIEELEWYRLTLTTIGGLFGEFVEAQSSNTYDLLENVLADESTPTDWLKNGLAMWIEGVQASANVVRGVASALSRSIGPSEQQSGVSADGEIAFHIDQFTQATDPVPIEIPEAAIPHVTYDSEEIPKERINLTRSGKGQVFVALGGLKPKELPVGSHDVKLTWGRDLQKTFK